MALLPEYFKRKMAERIEIRDSLVFEKVATNVSLIKIVSQNNKMLVAEFPDNIALFETPSGIELNENIIAQLKKRFPGKPLKYLFVTHHHPDHAGGLRAYAALPLTVVTTAGNQAYFEANMKKSHTMSNVLIDNTQKFRFDFVPLNGEKKFMGKVVAYEIGKSTEHTNEHLVYYFPDSKILWTGDLLNFRSGGRVSSAGQRGKAVYDLITIKKPNHRQEFIPPGLCRDKRSLGLWKSYGK